MVGLIGQITVGCIGAGVGGLTAGTIGVRGLEGMDELLFGVTFFETGG